MKSIYEKYKPEKFYLKENKECILCLIRKKLIIRTPEEDVRHSFIRYLIEEIKVPSQMIGVEVPMSYFKKGARGRADILIYGQTKTNETYVLCVIECKKRQFFLSDDVFEQVIRYDNIIQSDIIAVTNGDEIYSFAWNDKKSDYKSLKSLPQYLEMGNKSKYDFILEDAKPFKRDILTNPISKELIKEYIDFGIMGEDTNNELAPFIINFFGFLFDERNKIEPQIIGRIKIIEDGGIRTTEFGNASGEGFPGPYRYFIIEDEDKNNQIISISIFGTEKTVNHKRLGNRRGNTIILVAIDDFEKSHASLELNLDKNLIVNKKGKYVLSHDGKLTLGKKGAVKRSEIIDFIEGNSKLLEVFDNKIYLGTFEKYKEINPKNNGLDFIKNIIEYALLRDKFRKIKNKSSL